MKRALLDEPARPETMRVKLWFNVRLTEVTELSPHDSFVRSDAVVSRLIGGETLVVPVRGGVGDLASIFSFNDVGSTIWEALAQPMTVDELAAVVMNEYDVEREQACQDLEVFLTDMHAAGLVALKTCADEVHSVPQRSAARELRS